MSTAVLATAPPAHPSPVRARPEGRVLRWAVAAVIVALPFGDVAVPGVGLRLVYVAMCVPSALVVYEVFVRGTRLPGSVILVGCGLGFLSGVLSTAHGVDPDRSVPLVLISVVTACYAIAIVLAYRPGSERNALDLLVGSGGVAAALALISAGGLHAADAGNVVEGRLTGPFAQPNELGMFCAALLPVAIGCVVTSGHWARGVLLSAAAVCLATACLLSMSRGAWIGSLTALLCFAACEATVRRVIAAVGLLLATVCTLALLVSSNVPLLGVVGSRIRTLGDPTQNQYDDRPLIWAEAVRQAAEHPWLGVGPGAFSSVAAESGSAVSADPPEHAHDLLLTTVADRGVLGVAVGIVVVAGCLLAARRHVLFAPGPDPVAAPLRTRAMAVLAGLTAVLVHGAFDMPLRNPIVSGLAWTLLGMAIVAETVPLASYGVLRASPAGRRPSIGRGKRVGVTW